MIFTNKTKNNIPFKNLPPTTYHLPPKKGFTLIEMLVVIAIIGILYLIVFGSVSDSKKRSRDSKRIADISVIQLSLERYYDDPNNGKKYPDDLDALNDYDSSVLITDPFSGNDYTYTCAPVNNCQSYLLQAQLELSNNVLNDDADTNNTSSLLYDVVPKF